MAFGSHWEWRGFGAVSSKFASRYSELVVQREPHYLEDLYIWVPGLEANVKVRSGTEEGLKIKQKKSKDGRLEHWDEYPENVFNFPLKKSGRLALHRILATANLRLSPSLPDLASLEQTVTALLAAGCHSVSVQKWREGRLWPGPEGLVIVEWTCIHSPQAIISIGLENIPVIPDSGETGEIRAKNDILAAIEELALDEEPLKEMNYIDAVKVWASGEQIVG